MVAALTLLPATPAAAFPSADAGYHTYAELQAEVSAVASAHPSIVQRFSIGRSWEGRELWAAKVSDNVTTDEAEPEVLVVAGHHAGEHMGVEAAIGLLHALVDAYGTDVNATRRVNATELWIVFNLNPDGTEFDHASGVYRDWRKNRQPTPGSGAIGTDLNRNYDWAWGCCGGSSGDPWAWNYRGSAPWSAPESSALAAFVNSRVIDGRQQIRAHLTLHTFGRMVLWPWGHSAAGVPDSEDRAVFETLGGQMGQAAGYLAQQSVRLYVTDGDEIDWMYGAHRIFSFTLEMSNVSYPADEEIAGEVGRVLSAAWRLIDVAACPWSVTGRAAVHCPPSWVSRAAGNDRYATAAAVSGQTFSAPAPVVYIATGAAFPDALAGGVAAGRADGPLLLVAPNRIPAPTARELSRLRPGRIVVLGGPSAVSAGVVSALGAYGSVERLAGADRYATAAAVSSSAFPSGTDVAFVATGTAFPDGLAAVPAAVEAGAPLLLVRPDGVPAPTAAELQRLGTRRIVVVGGPSAVPESVVTALRTFAPDGVQRLAGADRYATAAVISASYASPGDPVFLATGTAFPDALAGGPAAAARGASLLLTKRGVLQEPTGVELGRVRPATITVLGGLIAVADEVAAAAALRSR
jgi:putative cell wall-binding protein